jgi:hypothetical protein
MKPELILLAEDIIKDIQGYIEELKDFIKDNGGSEDIKTMHELTKAVKNLRVVLKTKHHLGLIFDDNGYIVEAHPFDDFISFDSPLQVPNDVSQGFYLLIDGTVAVDEERKRQIEEV